MTSNATPTPSTGSSSSTTNQMFNTPISRMLYLRSDQADSSLGPSDKTWKISPVYTRGKYHNLLVRALHVLHLFPNIPQPVTLSTGNQTVTIPAGNYHPGQIAYYLTEQLGTTTVCWDQQNIVFRFDPAIDVDASSTAASLLGFKPGVNYTGVTQSVLPANTNGPQRIVVDTNLQLYNIPISGRLCVIPVKEKYGEVIQYSNFSSTYNHLCMDQYLDTIRIRLTDFDGNLLNGVDEIPWDISISFEPMDNPGFQAFAANLDYFQAS